MAGNECGKGLGFFQARGIREYRSHREVCGKNLSVAVEDHSPFGLDDLADAVLLRCKTRILVMLGDMEMDQSGREDRKDTGGDATGDSYACVRRKLHCRPTSLKAVRRVPTSVA